MFKWLDNLPYIALGVAMLFLLMSIYRCGQIDGILTERAKWQKIYVCQWDSTTGTQVCMQDGPVIIHLNPDKESK